MVEVVLAVVDSILSEKISNGKSQNFNVSVLKRQ